MTNKHFPDEEIDRDDLYHLVSYVKAFDKIEKIKKNG